MEAITSLNPAIPIRITAGQIDRWASTRDAQGLLPVILRKLIQATAKLRAIDIPGGDSVSAGGWDGIVDSTTASPWVPMGQSYWEFGCNDKVKSKADDDFSKRTAETASEDQASSTFIFVSPRKWSRKRQWIKANRAQGDWLEVRAYDANDLEQWLEQSPSVAIWFSELLGISGAGIESIDRRWQLWADQSSPALTRDSMLAGRSKPYEDLLKALRERKPFITLRADSIEEAIAFVAVSLLTVADQPSLLVSQAAVVTAAEGWRYLEANPGIRIAIVARPELAASQTPRDGLSIVLPLALGDRGSYFRGFPTQDKEDADIRIERLHFREFEEELVKLGFDPAEAGRLARSTSRSWSVFRRLHAINPSIASPPWKFSSASCALVTVCLVGAWSSNKAGDRAVIEAIANRPYEDIERDLRELEAADDAPILSIGSVWRAKSPLELLHILGTQITREALDRYFNAVENILSQPDPILELPDDQRWAAAAHGKVRTGSKLLIDSLCDSLIKFAVIGPNIPALAALSIEARVSMLVRHLLKEADKTRWLSLSDVLREVAEAAPDMFLEAVEASLSQPDPPVIGLLHETQSSGLSGRCWYADLLWALETLAWRPQHLGRVAGILVRLSTVPVKGNWANTPLNTLTSLFRSWLPQTAASIEQRIQVLDRVIAQDATIGWNVLCNLGLRYYGMAVQNARPQWRNDDDGVGHGATGVECAQMLGAVGERLLKLAAGNAARVACLIEHLHNFADDDWRKQILDMAESFVEPGATDNDRETVRKALRCHLHWHYNYSKDSSALQLQ